MVVRIKVAHLVVCAKTYY